MMKKHRFYLFTASVIALMMVFSCKKMGNSPASGDDGELITFSPSLTGTSGQTKGSMISGTDYVYDDLGPFWAMVYNGSAQLFPYTKVMQFTHIAGSGHTYWSTVDSSDNLKEYFWKKTGDNADKMYFYAYTNLPADNALVFHNTNSYQTVDYKVSECLTAGSQKDMLFAASYERGSVKTGYVGRFVSLNFRHPLVAVKFKKGIIEGLEKITDIKISGIYGQGSFRNDYTGISWSGCSGSVTASMSDNAGLSIGTDDIIGETFFLIPQDHSAKNITVKATLKVSGSTYTDVSATLSTNSWVAGKYYTYTLDFTSGNKPVLSVNLADWGSIDKDVEMDSGSVQTFGDPSVNPWPSDENSHLPYSD